MGGRSDPDPAAGEPAGGEPEEEPLSLRERLIGLGEHSHRKSYYPALRRKDEELLQAQKLEAIGRLAGGIAHDFNNLLTVIAGVGADVHDQLPEGDPLRAEMAEVLEAARRASELTRQLLAFGRKQLLQPRAVDVNAVVRGMERMLHRIIGEHVSLRTDLAPDAGGVFADPGQLEQVLINLVVNARDAMPRGGEIRITTRAGGGGDLGAAGGQVAIAIADDGVGMDAATRARLFEPFFTTKELGRGTGLGLSTVYGIVRQSGGEVEVESEPGHGTTFRVLLPHTALPVAAAAGQRSGPAPASGAGRTVLVVEDDAAVLRFVCESLRSGGYAPLACGDAGRALALGGSHPGPIHLLVSDVVIPGGSGPDLADALARRRPALRVLFISGYAQDLAAVQRRLGAGCALLQKPFDAAQLLAAVGRALAEPGASP